MSLIATLLSLAVVVASIAVMGLLNAAESATFLLSRGRVHRLAEARKRGALALERIAERQGDLYAAAALTRAAGYGIAAVVTTWSLRTSYPGVPLSLWALAGFGTALVAVFALGETLPRTVAVRNPEGVALAAAPVALQLTRLAYPLARVLSAPWEWLLRLAGAEAGPPVPWMTEEQYRSHLPADEEEEAAREESQEAILEAVTAFAEKVVREVMVPRTDMDALEDTASSDDALALIRETGRSRLPMFHETLDDIRGVLYAKDLLQEIGHNGHDVRPIDLAREPYFVPETKPIEELLVEMRARTHIAIVADEYGGTAGLVTIEDLLEEIVGDIFDEYDRQVSLVSDLGGGCWRVDGRLPVDELNERLGTSVEVDADTVAGLFTEIAGHIPEKGESLELEGLRLVVQELEGNRVRQLLVEPVGPRESEDEG